MAYINKNDFSIISSNDSYVDALDENYFECDDLIAPTISLLNKKGYKTTFCCSGHPFSLLDMTLVKDVDLVYEQNEVKILHSGNSKDLPKDYFGDEYDVFAEYKNYIVYENSLSQKMYIAFEEKYIFNELPENAYIEDGHIYMYYTDSDYCHDGFEGVTKVYEANKRLYEWAVKLPNLNEDKNHFVN